MDKGRSSSANSAQTFDMSDSLDATDANAPVSSFASSAVPYSVETLEVHEEGAQRAVQPEFLQYDNVAAMKSVTFSRRKATIVSAMITILVTIVTGVSLVLLTRKGPNAPSSSNSVPIQEVDLQGSVDPVNAPELEGAEEALLVNGDLITRGFLKLSRNAFVATIQSPDLDGNQTYELPNASGVFCLDSNNCDFATQQQLQQLQQQIPVQGGTAINTITSGSANLTIVNDGNGEVTITDTTADDPKVSSFNNRAGAIVLQGTPNRITVNSSGNTFTLTTPQDINTGATPTFSGLILSGLDCSDGELNGGALTTNGSGQLVCSDDDGGGGGGTVSSPGGVAGTIPVFTAAQTIDDSLITQSGGNIDIAGSLTLSTALGVGEGGTGVTSFTSNGVVLGNGSGALAATAAPLAGQVLLGNAGGVPTFTALSGDVTISATGVTAVQPNSVVVGTDTTGDYVASFTAGNGLTGTASGEGSTPTLNVVSGNGGIVANANDITLTVQANKGLEVDANGLSLIDCADDQVLKYDTGTNTWGCAADAGGSGVGDDVQVNGSNADGANFINNVASATAAAVTWSLSAGPNPDTVSLALGAASATDAGIVTANAQTFGGTKTFGDLITANGGLTIGVSDSFGINGDSFTDLTGTGLTVVANALQTTLGVAIDTTEITDGTILEVDLNSTNGPTDNYVLTYDQGSGGFTWVDPASVGDADVDSLNGLNGVLTLNGTTNEIEITDNASDTITVGLPNDVTIGDALDVTGLLSANGGVAVGGDTINEFASTGLQVVGNALQTTLGISIQDSEVDNNITISSGGAVDWLALTNYPTGCNPGEAVTTVGDTLTCSPFATVDTNTTYSAGNDLDLAGTTFNIESQLDFVTDIVRAGGNLNFQTTTSGDIVFNAAGIIDLQSGTTVSSGSLSLGELSTTNGALTLLNSANNFGVSIDAPNQTVGDATVSLPDTAGDDDEFCLLTLQNCFGSGGGITGSGTNGTIPRFTPNGSSLGDSSLTDDGTDATATGNFTIQGGVVTVGQGSSATGSVAFHNATNGNTVTLQSGATGGSYSLTLPTAQGGADQCLKNDGTGILSWDDCLGGSGGGGITTIDGQTGPSVNINNASGAGNVITIDNAAADGTTKGIAAFNATNFSAASGVINTIQGISTSATPQFAGLDLTGDLDIAGNNIVTSGATISSVELDVLDGGIDETEVTGVITAVDAGAGLTGGALSGSATLTVVSGNGGIVVNTDDITLTVQANKGLEVDANGLSLVDCADDQILKYDTGTNTWGCAADAGGSGLGDDVQVNGSNADGANFINSAASATVVATTWTLNGGPSPDTISLALGAATGSDAGIVTANAQAFGGVKTFNGQLIAGAGIDLGTTTLQGTTAVINFDDFDVDGSGNVDIGGTLDVASDATVGGDLDVTGNVTVAAGSTLTLVGDTTANRPGAPAEGTLFFDTDTNALLVYADGKWQADRSDAILVAANNSRQEDKDAADYVADGTDDQVQINAALDEADPAGNGPGKVYLFAGTYDLNQTDNGDATILIPNNTTLSGAGEGTLIRLDVGIGIDNAIENEDITTGTGIVVRDLHLDGSLSNTNSQFGIYLTAMGSDTLASERKGARLDNITVSGFENVGIFFDGSDNNVLANSVIRNGEGHGVSGDGNSNIVSGNSFFANDEGLGFILSGSNNVVTSNISYGSNSGGFSMSGSDGIFSNNQSSNESSVQITGDRFVISNNRITNAGGTSTNDGLLFTDLDDSTVTGNVISDNQCDATCYAINISDVASSNNYLADNLFTDTDGDDDSSINDAGTGTIFGGQHDANGNFQINPTGTIELQANTNVTGTLSVSGLITANGGLTIGASDVFTINGDAFTDLTGDGLAIDTGVLEVAIQANKGLEVDANGLSLIDCADDQVLKYDTGTNTWGCAADAGGSGVGDDVQVNGSNADGANFINNVASATAAAVTWSLSAGPNPDTVSLALGAASATDAGIVTANAQTFGGTKTFNGLLSASGGLTVTGTTTLSSLLNCNTLDTNGSGVLACGTDADTTYSAGNDLDLAGTTFNIESQLDFVTDIIRAGGDLNLETTGSGDVTINAAGTIELQTDTNVTGGLDVSGDVALGSSGAFDIGPDIGAPTTYDNVVSLQHTFTDLTTTTVVSGITNNIILDPAAPASSAVVGTLSNVEVAAANTNSLSALYGSISRVNVAGDGDVDAAFGTAGIIELTGDGTTNSAIGGDFSILHTGAGGIVNAIGVNVNAFSGTIGNAIGAAFVDQSSGTNANVNLLLGSGSPTGNYSLYSGSTYDSYFGGQVGIGMDPTSVASLQVAASGFDQGIAVTTVDGIAIAASASGNGNAGVFANVNLTNTSSTLAVTGTQGQAGDYFTVADAILFGDTILDVTDNGLTLGDSDYAGTLNIHDGTGQRAIIQVGNLAADRTLTIPVATGPDTFCLVNLANCSGSATTLQTTYNADVDSATAEITTTDADGSIVFNLHNSAGTDPSFRVNLVGTGNTFEVQDGGTAYFTAADARMLTYAGSNGGQFALTSDLTGGARSTALVSITQANNVTNNNTSNLLAVTNNDTASTGSALAVTQNGSGIGIEVDGGTTGIQVDMTGGSTNGIVVTGNSGTTTGLNLQGAVETGRAFMLQHNIVGNISGFTGDLAFIQYNRTKTGAGITTDTGNHLEINRSNTISNASGTFTVTGDLAILQSNCTQALGTCNDSSNILELNQLYANATGAVFNVLNSGTGNLATLDGSNASANGVSVDVQSSSSSQYVLSLTSNNGGINVLRANANGNVGIGTATPAAQFDVAGRVPSAALDTIATGDAPQDVAVQGRYAYVVNRDADTMEVYDVSDPANLTAAIGSVATGDEPYGIDIAGRYVYIVNSQSATLQVIDISNPTSPTSVATVNTDTLPSGVNVQGRYAYVSAATTNSLTAFDISNPTTPVALDSVVTDSGPQMAAVQGRYAYVPNYNDNTLEAIDISDPTNLTSVSSVATTGAGPAWVTVQGRYAYVANFTGGTFEIFDVSNPASMASVGNIAAGAGTGYVSVNGRYAYVANFTANNLQTYNITNPASPTLVGTVTTGTAPSSVQVVGRYAYVTNKNADTMMTFDLGGAYLQQLEAGAVETGSLSVTQSAVFLGQVDIAGGLNVGNSLGVEGNIGATGLMLRGDLGQTSDLLVLENNTGTDMFNVSATGAVTARNSIDSPQAFMIQTAAGTSILAADTSNYIIRPGVAPSLSTISRTTTQITSANNQGTPFNSIALGTDGLPILAYNDETTNNLMIGKCTVADCSSRITTQITSANNNGEYPAVVIGSDGLPVILHYNVTSGDPEVTHCSNIDCTAWTTQVISDADVAGTNGDISIGTDGLPIIAYRNFTDTDVTFTKCGNLTCSSGNTTTQVVNAADNVGFSISMEIGTDGLPIVSYDNATDTDLMITKCTVANCSTQTTTQIVTADVDGSWTSLAIGKDGKAIISSYNDTSDNIVVTRCTNLSCSTNTSTTMSTTDNDAQSTSISVGTDGVPLITHYNATDGDLNIARCTTASCAAITTTELSNADDVGGYSHIVHGKDGMPVIVYLNFTDTDVMVTKCADAACASATGSVLDDGVSLGSATASWRSVYFETLNLGKEGAHVQLNDLGNFTANNFTANADGSILFGDATNGISFNTSGDSQMRLTGLARNNASVTLEPEFEGATFSTKGPNDVASGANTGYLTSGVCSNEGSLTINSALCGAGIDHSFYEWNHNETADQDYYVYARYRMPADFDDGSLDSGSITIHGWQTDNANDNILSASIYNNAGALCGAAAQDVTASASGTWNAYSYNFATNNAGCDAVDKNEYITFVFRMLADHNGGAASDTIRLGEIEISYKSIF